MIPGFPITYYPIGGQFQPQLLDDAGKIFVGGIPADATKDSLTDYFTQFGEVSDCVIMVDNVTGRSRGFGFVTFLDAITVNKVLSHMKHCIHGKVVDAKRAVPKGPNQSSILRAMGVTSNRTDRNPECKVFVGGVAQGTTETDLETHFSGYGKVLEVKIPKDQNTHRARGFSFVLFESPESVIDATKDRYHRINGKMVEVKTVHTQIGKGQSDKNSDDGHMPSPSSSPYMQMSQRPNFYPPYQQNYLSTGHNFYESPYEPSPSGSTCSAASLGSTGFSIPNTGSGTRRLDEYPYMTPLYPAMNDLSISQQFPKIKNYPGMPRAQYQMSPNAEQLSATYTPPTGPTPTSVAFHNDLYGSSSAYPTMSAISAQVPPSQYGASTLQHTAVQGYSR